MSKEREYHSDGSYTDRYDDSNETSITYNPDGSTREESHNEHWFWGRNIGTPDIRVTSDGDGNRINTQNLKK